MSPKIFPFLNIIALAAVLTVNALANILPINGMNTGQVSALYPSLFTPAGFTFSIWMVIYVLLIFFTIIQWTYFQKEYFIELSILFLVSCVANISWILVWHHLFVYGSVAIMLVLLITLTRIFLLLHPQKFSIRENIFIKLPFTVYFSWICVATIANISVLLTSIPWDGSPLTEQLWTIIMLLIAAGLSIYITLMYNSTGYILVTMWALFGIYIKWVGSNQSAIATTSLALLILLALVFGTSFIRRLFAGSAPIND